MQRKEGALIRTYTILGVPSYSYAGLGLRRFRITELRALRVWLCMDLALRVWVKVLRGSWVVVSGVTSRVTLIITHIRVLITHL